MPTYTMYCEKCSYTEEIFLKVSDRNKFVGMPCAHCGTPLSRDSSSHGGFRLGTDGKVGWSEDGYATTYGDSENFKAGRRVY